MTFNELFEIEMKKDYFIKLQEFIDNEYNTKVIYPPKEMIYNAFKYNDIDKIKVIIIGQDPYHNVGQAHGLCFSVKPGIDAPPSLVNIYKELQSDLGLKIPNNGYLVKWAEQGVLLLNTVLTVRAHQANSHRGIGWEQFTDAVIKILDAQDRPIVFLLWGAPAQKKKEPSVGEQMVLTLRGATDSLLDAYKEEGREYAKEVGDIIAQRLSREIANA